MPTFRNPMKSRGWRNLAVGGGLEMWIFRYRTPRGLLRRKGWVTDLCGNWCVTWGAWRDIFVACQIERRPRGASRAALAPTFVSGQSCLEDLCANALAHGAIWRCTNKAVPRACHGRNWPETDVGASAARDAPRGRRWVLKAQNALRRTQLSLVALLLRRGMPRRWRRSHRHLRLTPSLRANSVSVMWSWCSSTKCWK